MAITEIKIDGRVHNFSDTRIVGFDNKPTSGSDKLLTSGSVYAAISDIETAEECDNE